MTELSTSKCQNNDQSRVDLEIFYDWALTAQSETSMPSFQYYKQVESASLANDQYHWQAHCIDNQYKNLMISNLHLIVWTRTKMVPGKSAEMAAKDETLFCGMIVFVSEL